jgi:hypothetical protein
MALENQLELESLRAWQQLLQVLTHEIMSSLTPIKSLSETAQGLLDPMQRASCASRSMQSPAAPKACRASYAPIAK